MSIAPIHLLIADDHPLIRSGLRAQIEPLGGQARFKLSEASDAASLRQRLAYSAATEDDVELALVDVMMPGMQGAPTLLELAQAHPQVAFLLVTGLPPAQAAQLAASVRSQANIRGLLGKSHSASELRRAIDLALAGIPVWPAMDSLPADGLHGANTFTTDAQSVSASDAMQGLSPRQRAVALAVARGMSNAQIASALGLTEGTVKAYLKDVFRHLGVSSRTQLVLRIGGLPA